MIDLWLSLLFLLALSTATVTAEEECSFRKTCPGMPFSMSCDCPSLLTCQGVCPSLGIFGPYNGGTESEMWTCKGKPLLIRVPGTTNFTKISAIDVSVEFYLAYDKGNTENLKILPWDSSLEVICPDWAPNHVGMNELNENRAPPIEKPLVVAPSKEKPAEPECEFRRLCPNKILNMSCGCPVYRACQGVCPTLGTFGPYNGGTTSQLWTCKGKPMIARAGGLYGTTEWFKFTGIDESLQTYLSYNRGLKTLQSLPWNPKFEVICPYWTPQDAKENELRQFG